MTRGECGLSGTAEDGEIERLKAKLDRERAKVGKLVAMRDRHSARRIAWLAERGALQRRLAVLESQHRLLIAAPGQLDSPGSPLRILVWGPVRKTIVEFLGGAMITGDPEQGPFDLVVIPRPEKQDLDQVASGVPEAVWRAVRTGRTRVVLDGSSEGKLHRTVIGRFRSLAERTGAPLGQMTYLMQDRLAAPGWGEPGPSIDVPLPVINYDYYLHKTVFPMLKHGQPVFRRRLAGYRKASRRGRRAFLSLNLAPRGHRVVLLSRLLRDGVWDNGFVSFGGFGPAGGDAGDPDGAAPVVDWGGFETAGEELAPWVAELHRKGVLLFGVPEGPEPSAVAREVLRAGELREYRRSWFSVVTETEMRRDTLRVTEKVLKPLLNFHPFVVLGNPGALRLIQSYGFQTFPEIFDESYDDEVDPVRRFDLVYDQVVRMARMDEAELDRLEASVAEKVVFNARWGLTRLPHLFQDTLLPAAIAQLLPPESATAQR